MSDRYRYAITATESNNLLDLAKLLTGAVNEALLEGQMPHMDPAVRLICYQISLVGNGDHAVHGLYEKTYEYCVMKANNSSNFEFMKVEVPEYKAN